MCSLAPWSPALPQTGLRRRDSPRAAANDRARRKPSQDPGAGATTYQMRRQNLTRGGSASHHLLVASH